MSQIREQTSTAKFSRKRTSQAQPEYSDGDDDETVRVSNHDISQQSMIKLIKVDKVDKTDRYDMKDNYTRIISSSHSLIEDTGEIDYEQETIKEFKGLLNRGSKSSWKLEKQQMVQEEMNVLRQEKQRRFLGRSKSNN